MALAMALLSVNSHCSQDRPRMAITKDKDPFDKPGNGPCYHPPTIASLASGSSPICIDIVTEFLVLLRPGSRNGEFPHIPSPYDARANALGSSLSCVVGVFFDFDPGPGLSLD